MTKDELILIILLGAVFLILLSWIFVYVTDNWIRVKDSAYRIEKYMHLNIAHPGVVTRNLMKFLKFVSKY